MVLICSKNCGEREIPLQKKGEENEKKRVRKQDQSSERMGGKREEKRSGNEENLYAKQEKMID